MIVLTTQDEIDLEAVRVSTALVLCPLRVVEETALR